MNMQKVSRVALLIGAIVAIVAAFVSIPQLALILLVLGAVAGWDAPVDKRVSIMVTALVLIGLSGELNAIPAVGGYLAAIFGSLGVVAVGSSIVAITQNVIARVTR